MYLSVDILVSRTVLFPPLGDYLQTPQDAFQGQQDEKFVYPAAHAQLLCSCFTTALLFAVNNDAVKLSSELIYLFVLGKS